MVICLAVDCKSDPGNRPKFKYISMGQKSKTCTYRKFKHHQNAKISKTMLSASPHRFSTQSSQYRN